MGEAVKSKLVKAVEIDRFVRDEDNPIERIRDRDAMKELQKSIEHDGLLNPPHAITCDGGRDLRIVAGERRITCCRNLKMKTIPAFVWPASTPAAEIRRVAFVDNVLRLDLNPIEEAAQIAGMIEAGETIESIAACLGWSKSKVVQRNALNDIAPAALKYICNASQPWTMRMLLMVARSPANVQADAIRECARLEKDAGMIHVAELQVIIGELGRELHNAPWIKADPADLVSDAPACAECPKQSSAQPSLFPELKKGDRQCTDGECFDRKRLAWVELQITKAKEKHGERLAVADSHTMHRVDGGLETVRKAAGGKLVNQYEYRAAKKSDRDAVPVLNSATGEIKYAVPNKPAKASPASDRDKTEAVKAKQLDAICQGVIDEIEALIYEPLDLEQFAHSLSLETVAAWLVNFYHAPPASDAKAMRAADRGDYRFGDLTDWHGATVELVGLVLDEWAARLEGGKWNAGERLPFARWVCNQCGFDFATIQKNARQVAKAKRSQKPIKTKGAK